jgi:hypothetical protein
MWRLSYTDEANDDLVEVAVYIADQSASREVDASFTDHFRKRCWKLATLRGMFGRD